MSSKFQECTELYDATAVWLRDVCMKGDYIAIKHVEDRMAELDAWLARSRFEK